MNAALEELESNVKFCGNHILKKNEVVQMKSINAVIRITDAEEEVEFIDLEARNAFSEKKVTISMTECAGFNYCRLRYTMINNNIVEVNCPHCDVVKTWDHFIKCKEKASIRREFVKELVSELVKNKP